ncbi:MAG: hypothetical protein LUO93_09755 [Methanomicrobiales archaeon]|nr:hypothetical protein [Methanomicrobiales archaeon]
MLESGYPAAQEQIKDLDGESVKTRPTIRSGYTPEQDTRSDQSQVVTETAIRRRPRLA